MRALKQYGVDDNTLVIFSSDNGSTGRDGGSNEPLAGAKGSTMEGGMRVPMIARWPDRVPAGSECQALTTTMDILPTFAAITGAKLPKLPIDGHNILPLLSGESKESPYEVFYYYRVRQLQAVRMGDWKWHLPLTVAYKQWDKSISTPEVRPAKLINLRDDIKETTDLSGQHPEIVEKMKQYAAKAIAELGNEELAGSAQRQPLDLAEGKPMLLTE